MATKKKKPVEVGKMDSQCGVCGCVAIVFASGKVDHQESICEFETLPKKVCFKESCKSVDSSGE